MMQVSLKTPKYSVRKSGLVILLFLVSGFFFLPSCKKYPDGPAFSLAGKKARLCNKWTLEKMFVNGIEQPKSQLTYRIFIYRDGTYGLGYWDSCCVEYSENGTWALTGKKQDVTFKYKGEDPVGGYGAGLGNTPQEDGEHSLEIRRLKGNALWLKEKRDNGDVWDLRFKTYHPL